MTEAGSIFNKRPMPETKLPHPSRHHVHQDLLISNCFGCGFNEIGFHNN